MTLLSRLRLRTKLGLLLGMSVLTLVAAVAIAASLAAVGIVAMRGGGAGGTPDNSGPPTGVQIRRPHGVSIIIR
jgi:hypothetical protein